MDDDDLPELVIAAGNADLSRLSEIIDGNDPNCWRFAEDAVNVAIVNAALSEDDRVAKDGIACAALIADRFKVSAFTIILQELAHLNHDNVYCWAKKHFACLFSETVSQLITQQASNKGFGLRYLEFKFNVALREYPQAFAVSIDTLEWTCFRLLKGGSMFVRDREMGSPQMIDLCWRIMAKHTKIKLALARIFEKAQSRQLLGKGALLLGVHMGFVKVDLEFFCEFFQDGLSPHVSREDSRYSYHSAAVMSRQLVDLDSEQRLDFNRPGVISFSAHAFDSAILFLLKCPDPLLLKSIMSNLLRCRKFVEHDPRFVAWSIFQRLREKVKCWGDSRFWIPTSAEIWYCCEWLRAEFFKSSEIARQSVGELPGLFIRSTVSTAQDVWSLGLMVREVGMDVTSLKGLLSFYHPFMTKAALRCLLWNHPLSTQNFIQIRERHYEILSRILDEGQHGGISQLCNLSLVARELQVVRIFPRLFRTPLPPRARHVVIGFIL